MKRAGKFNEFEKRLGKIIFTFAKLKDSAKVEQLKEENARLKSAIHEYMIERRDFKVDLGEPDQICAIDGCKSFRILRYYTNCSEILCMDHMSPCPCMFTGDGVTDTYCPECHLSETYLEERPQCLKTEGLLPSAKSKNNRRRR